MLLLIIRKNKKLITVLMLEVIKEIFNLGLNRLTGMKIGNDTILLNLIILQKLWRISILIIVISRNLKQKNKIAFPKR